MDEAYITLLQYGALGAITVASIIYVSWNTRNTARVLNRKDEELSEINERRVEAAMEAVAAITVLSQQIKEAIELIKKQNGGDHVSEDG